jgi:NADH:ubiquinone oxidoreductase subunit F (NADH-binding)
MGITLREVIYEIGGGIPGGKKFKMAQTGGTSGGCIPAEYLDLPMDYDTLAEAGTALGSGALLIMDETTALWMLPNVSCNSSNMNHAESVHPAAKGLTGCIRSWTKSVTAWPHPMISMSWKLSHAR